MTLLILFLFGLIFGSFLNVVIARYEPELSIFSFKRLRGRSKCLHCKKSLKWYELIPVASFFIQRMKCRGCSKSISWRYPLVEILSGLIFVSIPFFTDHFYVGYWIALFLILLVIFFVDKDHMIIPNELNLAIVFVGLATIITDIYFGASSDIILSYLFAALVSGSIFYMFVGLSGGKAMGWGDVKLVVALSFVFGWPVIVMIMALSFILGGIYGAIVLLIGRNKFGDKIPFGPFIVIASTATFFFGNQILSWYLGLLGL